MVKLLLTNDDIDINYVNILRTIILMMFNFFLLLM